MSIAGKLETVKIRRQKIGNNCDQDRRLRTAETTEKGGDGKTEKPAKEDALKGELPKVKAVKAGEGRNIRREFGGIL